MDLAHNSWPERGAVISIAAPSGRKFYLIADWNDEVWYFQLLASHADNAGRPPFDDFLLRNEDAQEWVDANDGIRVHPDVETRLLDLNEV